MNGNNSQALRDAEIDEGRNQEKHKVLMVNKTTSFKKRTKGRRGTSRRTTSKLLLKWWSPSLVLSLRLSASTAKGLVAGCGTTPSIWRIRRMAKWTKVYLIYMLLMCTLLVFIATPQYLILVQLLKISNLKRGLQNEQRLVKGKLTMRVGSGSKIDMIIIAHSLYFRD